MKFYNFYLSKSCIYVGNNYYFPTICLLQSTFHYLFNLNSNYICWQHIIFDFIFQKIVSTILAKAKTLSPTNATTILFALLNIDTPIDGYRQLLNYSLEVVTKNIELSDEKRVLLLLKLCRSQGFYHSPFFFEAAKKVVTEKWGLESTWEVVNIFSSVRFFPSEMMDHFVSVLCLEADTLRTSPQYPILNCVEYFTATGYRPPHLSAALRILCSCESKIKALTEKNSLLLVKFLSCLAMLGHFPENYLSSVLDEEFLFDVWSKSRKLGRNIFYIDLLLFSFTLNSV